MDKKWQIWIDTGGTFTDCIAFDPNGDKHTLKVLSSGRLRGQLLKKTGIRQYKFSDKWNLKHDIFRGYTFQLLGQKHTACKVESIDFANHTMSLSQDLPLPQSADFEITAHEEAPVLAARLMTQTPLHGTMPLLDMRLGSTKGTNALLESKGAQVTFLVTKGLKDLLVIGTQQRPHLFQLAIPEAEQLYAAVIEVDERLDADGEVIQALAKTEQNRVIQSIRTEAVAIAFMHAYKNPVHERQMGHALSEAGHTYISLSHALAPTIKILPRAQTALVNAYLNPVITQYLGNIQEKLAAAELLVMTSAGGLVKASLFQPKNSLLSGPAGGVVGAAKIAEQLGCTNILTLDMGGTSTDCARYDGKFDYQFLTRIGPVTFLSPALAIETVAAGGGSICYFDGNKLTVGPESAGASPGPACYGAGGPLTITDVNLLLGKLEPSAMGIPINIQAAEEALHKIRSQMERETETGYSPRELLRGFEKIANEKMADAIRRISIAKGFDPKAYALLAFGGAGGLHACQIAELLEIETIILPHEGGLLSAYGIGHARIERLAEKQVLELLENYYQKIDGVVQSLSAEAFSQLQQEGFQEEEIEIVHAFVYLRFKGQESTLEIEYKNKAALLPTFREKYLALFGHYPDNRPVEVESVKLIAANRMPSVEKERKERPPFKPSPVTYQSAYLDDHPVPVFYWKDLLEGARINGPAILLHAHSTAFIEKNWQLAVRHEKNAVIQRQKIKEEGEGQLKEAIALELFTNRFLAIAEEMGAQLQRTAFSVNVKERLDFSCAILDAKAELLVNAPHIPVHLGSLGICARLVKEKIDLGPGDVVITNHPKYGGSHLPDVTLLSAVYTDQQELIGYVINRAHHAEIGGKRPGSMPPDARSLEEEGVVIVPQYLVKGGQIQWKDLEDLLTKAPFPTRALAENLADVNAALASLKSGADALKSLVQTHGLEKVHYYMAALQDTARQALQKSLQPFLNKTFRASEKLDDGHEIKVQVEVTDERIAMDFSGSSEVHPFNLNANISIVYSVVIYVLRLLCGRDIPLNEGLMQGVQIHLPNSFLHPDFKDDPTQCPAVVGGNTEVSQRLADTLIKAFKLAACSQGTMNNFLFGNDTFGYYETICGGVGAVEGHHGRSGVHQHMTNTRITDPEEMERRYPVRLIRFAFRAGSGGKGKWQGGDGIIRELMFLQPVEMTILSQHRKEMPYGLQGGQPGKAGQQILIRKNGGQETLHGVDSRSLQAGDRVIIETPGGGGWGKGDIE